MLSFRGKSPYFGAAGFVLNEKAGWGGGVYVYFCCNKNADSFSAENGSIFS
jgi:hypothetical protein